MDKFRLLNIVVSAIILVGTFSRDVDISSFDRVKRIPAEASNITYDDLKVLIQNPSQPIRDLDSLIASLPQNLGSQFVLMHSSESIQAATPKYPRILFYSDDAKLVLGVSSLKGSLGFNQVEVMQYRDDTGEFDFKEIDFPDAKGSQAVTFVDHPRTCINCHGNPAKPIWDSYDLWPGAYGSFDDTLYPDSKEWQDFSYFFSNILGKEAHLFLKPNGAPDYGHEPSGSFYRPFQPEMKAFEGFNSMLTARLNRLNQESVWKQLTKMPEYQKYKYALIGASRNCNVTGFIPKKLSSIHSKTVDSYLSDTTDKMDEAQKNRLERYRLTGGIYEKEFSRDSNYNINTGDYLPSMIANLRFIVEPLGVVTNDWSTTRERGAYSFADGHGAGRLFQNAFIDELATNQELKELFPQYVNFNYAYGGILFAPNQCQTLQTLSLKALDTVDKSTLKKEIAAYKAADAATRILPLNQGSFASLQSCVSCHTGTNPVGPAIPFDDPQKFMQLLPKPLLATDQRTLHDEISYRIESDGPDHMPQGRNLDDQDKEAIHTFIDSFIQKK